MPSSLPPVEIDIEGLADPKPVSDSRPPEGGGSRTGFLAAAASVVGAPIESPVQAPAAEVAERKSEPPPPPAHIVVPNDDVPAPPSKPTPAPAIHVMRIIAVGSPTVERPPEVAQVVAESLSSEDITEEPPVIVAKEEPEELSEEDVAPDSDRVTPAAAAGSENVELGRDDAISIPPEEVAAPAPSTSPAKGEVKPPPPPPRRAPSSRRSEEAEPQSEAQPMKSKRAKRAWWDDLFGEDFVRASFRLNEQQIAREVNFIEDSLGVAKGGVVLDLGCGSGHHAVELASRGYGVVGYDLSLYQLALAAEVAQDRDQKINFLQGDMREMAFEEMFDGVFCWNTTFGYFEEEKNVNVAQRVFKALKPGGMFLVDVINRDFAATQSPSSLWYEGDACVCMDDMSVDFITSRLRVKRSIILDDGRTRECAYSIRLYSLHELGKLLHDVGFRVAEASGHPAMPGVFFGQQSPRIIMLAQKP